jgi:hypothetical protein
MSANEYEKVEQHEDRDTFLTPEDPHFWERGAAGYIVAWLLGIPASILVLIFLLRGCD